MESIIVPGTQPGLFLKNIQIRKVKDRSKIAKHKNNVITLLAVDTILDTDGISMRTYINIPNLYAYIYNIKLIMYVYILIYVTGSGKSYCTSKLKFLSLSLLQLNIK